MQAMTLRLPDEVHEALRREAFEKRTSMQKLILEAIQARAIRGHWSNGDPVHLIVDGEGGRRVAPNLNGATWIQD